MTPPIIQPVLRSATTSCSSSVWRRAYPTYKKTIAGGSIPSSPRSIVFVGGCLCSSASAASSIHRTRCASNNNNNDRFDWDDILNQCKDGKFSSASKAIRKNVATVAGEKIQAGIDTGIPTQLSYGFLSGYCSGYALKKVGKTAALVFGLGFMSLQTLSYYGYIQIDHSAFQREIMKAFDLNNDGSIDRHDGQIAFEKITNMLKIGLPSTSGFVGGFVGGLRSG